MLGDIIKECESAAEKVQKERAYLHMHPELSGEEFETLEYIKGRLSGMGLPFEEIEDGGILAWLDSGKPGKTLLLRADIDALPVRESADNLKGPKEVVSSREGVSHACGHDAHTAMLLNALEILIRHKDELKGKIAALFERGEESAFGITAILKYMLENQIRPDGCFAIHVNAAVPEGKISVEPGNVMCGAFGFDVSLIGRSGHSSRPDLSNNPVDCFVSIYNDLNGIRMRHTDPSECLTWAVGFLQGGDKSNVIPERVRFSCLGRFFDAKKTADPFLEQALKIVDKDAEIYDCRTEYGWIMKPIPSVHNHEMLAGLAGKWFREYIGEDSVTHAEPWMASESYSFFSIMYPSVLAFLGIQNDQGCGAAHHSPEFDLKGGLLYKGVEAFAVYAVCFLNSDAEAVMDDTPEAVYEAYKDRLF